MTPLSRERGGADWAARIGDDQRGAVIRRSDLDAILDLSIESGGDMRRGLFDQDSQRRLHHQERIAGGVYSLGDPEVM
jgi:hypothetical protein